ncbi:hypothetical protein TNCV_4734561 [Trichonephila clavipes]|nr:hypothetical protein TNCV_4734561 [Trichonephila clavipes]
MPRRVAACIHARDRASLKSTSVVVNAACLTVSERSPWNSSRQRASCAPVISSSFENRTGDSMSGASHLSSPSLMRGLADRQLFRVTPCRKSTLILQTSMPSPGFEPRPNATEVRVTYHCSRLAIYEFFYRQ